MNVKQDDGSDRRGTVVKMTGMGPQVKYDDDKPNPVEIVPSSDSDRITVAPKAAAQLPGVKSQGNDQVTITNIADTSDADLAQRIKAETDPEEKALLQDEADRRNLAAPRKKDRAMPAKATTPPPPNPGASDRDIAAANARAAIAKERGGDVTPGGTATEADVTKARQVMLSRTEQMYGTNSAKYKAAQAKLTADTRKLAAFKKTFGPQSKQYLGQLKAMTPASMGWL